MKIVAAFVAALFFVQTAFAAEVGVFVSEPVARDLLTRLYACDGFEQELSICDQQKQNAEEQARILEEGVRAGDADLVALRAEADALSGNLKEVAADLSECERTKPSWWSGFGWGSAVTAVAAAVLAGLALK